MALVKLLPHVQWTSSVVTTHTLSRACPTDALALPIPCVLGRELVSVNAVRLYSIHRRKTNAAKDILAISDWLKMPRVNATPIATKMIELESVRDWPDDLFIVPSVRHRQTSLASFRTERTIKSTPKSSDPNPAPRDIVNTDVAHKSSHSGKFSTRRSYCQKRISRGSPALVVLCAPSSNNRASIVASFNRTSNHDESLSRGGDN